MTASCPYHIPPIVLLLLPVALLSGCANQGYSIIASTATTIGVGISQQPTSGSLDATLGYKRAELAFVPTNRRSGADPGSVGGGARDSGNVIMELRYSGSFFDNANAGIYQRLAVGDVAVQQDSTTLLFAKDSAGNIDTETARAILNVKALPAVAKGTVSAKLPLSDKYRSYQNDPTTREKFNSAVKGVKPDNSDYKSFDDFILEKDTPEKTIENVRNNLEALGISFSS